MKHDPVNNPAHYKQHPSGVECIQITAHMNFCLGNAVKYIWRADLKHNAVEDLRKAKWYIEREIELREGIARAAQSGLPDTVAGTGDRGPGEVGAVPPKADNQGPT
ncbi:DUF3310 domain-containing protein [Marinobacter nauticus]|uniref:DUF3310 domain-containing protein n=1 Tax=Marinobacter nauticus TaxID=2743 RepID=UPI0009FAAAB0|nr:DUF3310 domain-containing protein [Marinobacter nauticus]